MYIYFLQVFPPDEMVFLYNSASYTNYIFLESTYNTDSHSKITAVGKDFEIYIYIRIIYAITHKWGFSFESYCINESME